MKIGILVSKNSWFKEYSSDLELKLCHDHEIIQYDHHDNLKIQHDILFILSYFEIIPPAILSQNKHNLVIHESALPAGKGWSPLFWQILEKKNSIPIVLFEAAELIDSGCIYLEDTIELDGTELNPEIRKVQAYKTLEMCEFFVNNYEKIIPREQEGESSYYPKRTPEDSELDINKSIKNQFNLLRICDNDSYPAFFVYRDTKYIIKIFKE